MANRRLDNQVELHPDYKNWQEFLTDYTSLKIEYNGWKLYSSCNCHYAVSPGGEIFVSYGYHAWKMFEDLTGMDSQLVRDLI